MSLAKVSETSAISNASFEDGIVSGIAGENKPLRNVRAAWVKEQRIPIKAGRITEYQVNLTVTFVIDE